MKHEVFACPRAHKFRVELEMKIERIITPENIVEVMLEGDRTWGAVTSAPIGILRAGEDEERRNDEVTEPQPNN